MKQYSDAKTRLNMMADEDRYSDAERLEIATYLMQRLQPQIDEVYGIIRDYENNGVIPSAPADDVVADTVEKVKRAYTLRTHISRYKARLKKQPSDTAAQRKLDTMQKEYDELSAALNL